MLFNGKYYNKPGHLGMTRQQLKEKLQLAGAADVLTYTIPSSNLAMYLGQFVLKINSISAGASEVAEVSVLKSNAEDGYNDLKNFVNFALDNQKNRIIVGFEGTTMLLTTDHIVQTSPTDTMIFTNVAVLGTNVTGMVVFYLDDNVGTESCTITAYATHFNSQ